MITEEESWTFERLVDPEHTAIVVVDMQNDFCSESGSLHKLGKDLTRVRRMAPILSRFLRDARRLGVRIFHTQNTNSEETFSPAMRRKRNGPLLTTIDGSWGADWFEEYEEFTPRDGEHVIQKHRYSAFIGTNFAPLLRSFGIKTLIVTGTATNVCVESTARDGFMLDFHILVLKDCIATSYNDRLHDATLENIDAIFGTVSTSEEVVRAWSKN